MGDSHALLVTTHQLSYTSDAYKTLGGSSEQALAGVTSLLDEHTPRGCTVQFRPKTLQSRTPGLAQPPGGSSLETQLC